MHYILYVKYMSNINQFIEVFPIISISLRFKLRPLIDRFAYINSLKPIKKKKKKKELDNSKRINEQRIWIPNKNLQQFIFRSNI